MDRTFVCYAERNDSGWEAFCLDLDIAIDGKSFDEVYGRLNETIRTYIQDASAEAPEQRERLLNRRAPLSVRLGILAKFAVDALWNKSPRNSESATFHVPCHA